MAYQFDVSYPLGTPDDSQLFQKQTDILRRFPQCKYMNSQALPAGFHTTIYSTNDPQSIARIASVLRQADPRLFISFINKGNNTIYHHPLTTLTPTEKAQYLKIMANLPQTERILHDYLVNLYHSIPTH